MYNRQEEFRKFGESDMTDPRVAQAMAEANKNMANKNSGTISEIKANHNKYIEDNASKEDILKNLERIIPTLDDRNKQNLINILAGTSTDEKINILTGYLPSTGGRRRKTKKRNSRRRRNTKKRRHRSRRHH